LRDDQEPQKRSRIAQDRFYQSKGYPSTLKTSTGHPASLGEIREKPQKPDPAQESFQPKNAKMRRIFADIRGISRSISKDLAIIPTEVYNTSVN